MFLVIAYDISDDKRRLRIAAELEQWGERTQFSVFECDLDESEEVRMRENLIEIIEEGDALRIYRLCEACLSRTSVIGGEDIATDRDFYQI